MNKDSYEGVLISRNWDFCKTFEWLCENAYFIFSYPATDGIRIKIFTKTPIQDMSLFEVGYDRYGVTIESDAVFNNQWGSQIIDISKNIIPFIKEYLIKEGTSDLIVKNCKL